MKPNKHNPETHEKQEATSEHVQFSDGHMAIGFRTPGDHIELDFFTYTRNLQNRGSSNVAIVATKSGRRFAVGKSVAVMLPEYSKESGKYKYDVDTPVSATSVRGNLPDITIGQPWELVGQDDNVTDVMFDYKWTTPGQGPGEQLGVPSPFEHAKEILENTAEKLDIR